MFSTVSFPSLDFQMGDSNNRLTQDYLSYRDRRKMQEDNERAQFEAAQSNLKRQSEMTNLAGVMPPPTGVMGGVNGLIAGPGVGEPFTGLAGRTGSGRAGGVRYDPSLEEYRKGQLEINREKNDIAREKNQSQSEVAERGVSVKERLAMLKDLPESERLARLQDGRMDLAEYNASASMKRQELVGQQRTGQIEQQGDIRSNQIDQQGNIRTKQIEQQGNIDYNKIEKQGKIGSSYITQRGEEARKTKTTPDSTQQTEAQKKVGLQSKAIQAINADPTLAGVITFNDQGFPVISPDAPPDRQMDAYKVLYGTTNPRGDVNLPVQPLASSRGPVPSVNTGAIPPAQTPTKEPVKPPVAAGGTTVQTKREYSPSRNQTRVSTDGGKTWKILPGKQ